jgi:hypothetical protein
LFELKPEATALPLDKAWASQYHFPAWRSESISYAPQMATEQGFKLDWRINPAFASFGRSNPYRKTLDKDRQSWLLSMKII